MGLPVPPTEAGAERITRSARRRLLGAMYLRCPGYGVTGFGAAGGARTRGLLFPKQVRFQLRYSDMERAAKRELLQGVCHGHG